MRALLDGRQAGNRSGTGRYAVELGRALAGLADGPELRVIVPEPDFCELDRIAPGRVVRCSAAAPPFGTIARNLSIRRETRRYAPEIVHFPANIGSLVRLPGNARTVVTVHDTTFMRNAGWFKPARALYYRVAARRSLGLADRVIADSTASADDILNFFGVPAARIDVVPLGVSERFTRCDSAAIAELRARLGLPERFFLYVGTLEPRKNLERVVDAWSAIAAKDPIDLVVAGRAGWKVGPLLRRIERSPYRDRIHRVGYVAEPDLPALLSSAYAFVWPSLWEGFGLPPLEAMACGVPVLSSAVSSMPEVLGDDALLVDPENTDAIAAGLLRLARDEKLHAALRERGPARARRYTWKRTAELTVESYARAMADSSGRRAQ